MVTLFRPLLVGSYVAGRIVSRTGTEHGVLVVVLALVITIILALLGAAVVSFWLKVPSMTFNVPGRVSSEVSGLGTLCTVSGLLILIFIFARGPSAESEALGSAAPSVVRLEEGRDEGESAD